MDFLDSLEARNLLIFEDRYISPAETLLKVSLEAKKGQDANKSIPENDETSPVAASTVRSGGASLFYRWA